MTRVNSEDFFQLNDFLEQISVETRCMRNRLDEFAANEKLLNEKLNLSQKIISNLLQEKTTMLKFFQKNKQNQKEFERKLAEACRVDQNIRERLLTIDDFWKKNCHIFEFKTEKANLEEWNFEKEKFAPFCENCVKLKEGFLEFEKSVMEELRILVKEVNFAVPEIVFQKMKSGNLSCDSPDEEIRELVLPDRFCQADNLEKRRATADNELANERETEQEKAEDKRKSNLF